MRFPSIFDLHILLHIATNFLSSTFVLRLDTLLLSEAIAVILVPQSFPALYESCDPLLRICGIAARINYLQPPYQKESFKAANMERKKMTIPGRGSTVFAPSEDQYGNQNNQNNDTMNPPRGGAMGANTGSSRFNTRAPEFQPPAQNPEQPQLRQPIDLQAVTRLLGTSTFM